ncbi:gliding motility-associated C-terminal domain-containing protein [Daejeonella sp.]|uniref:gliding motility-associated C-terminal domain-containing protein n=1 Tax=Daejeonella sp. TaxID=2805397 RepID=UPI0030ED299C
MLFLASTLSQAQELIQISLQSGDAFAVHSGETVGIFSDVKNAGSFVTHRNSVISFFGQRWTNTPAGRIMDESTGGVNGQGGIFRFQSLTNSAQYIESQNIQANTGFPNLTIANSGNVNLEGADLVVRGNLHFDTGHLILNNRNAILGSNATITGFNKDKFVVTGSGTNGGFLVRSSSGLAQPDLVFPVGTGLSSYTPGALNHRGVAQEIKVRVFDNVYSKAVLGIPDNVTFVPKTWSVSFSINDPTAVLALNTQHHANDEGPNFAANRSTSYLSRYVASTESWDKVAPTAIAAGSITSGTAIPNAYVHTRTGITGVGLREYFAKSTGKATATSGLRIPEGISPNNDGLNEKFIIENLKPTDQVRLDIYNRWQTLVFRDGNYKNTFDGIGNQKGLVNNELPDGTYYYILNINTEKPITGYLVINR